MAIFGLMFLVALANLVAWPVALVLLPLVARWIPWAGITASGARRGRNWGGLAYGAMLLLAGAEWSAALLLPGMEALMGFGVAYTATVGVAGATVAATVTGCFASGREKEAE